MNKRSFSFNFSTPVGSEDNSATTTPASNQNVSDAQQQVSTATSSTKPFASKSKKRSNKKQISSISPSIDKNPVFNQFYNERNSDVKFKDVFWNRVILRNLQIQLDPEAEEEAASLSKKEKSKCSLKNDDLMSSLDLFHQELKSLAQKHQYYQVIQLSMIFYYIAYYIYSQYEKPKQKKFVLKWMKNLVQEELIDSLLSTMMLLRDDLKKKGIKYHTKQFYTSNYITFLKLVAGFMFLAARCGCAKRLHKNLFDKYKWAFVSRGQDKYGSDTRYEWTWAIVLLACLETAPDSVLPLYLDARTNLVDWITKTVASNIDAFPYFAVVFQKLLPELHARSLIDVSLVESLCRMYFAEEERKVYILPLLKKFFCGTDNPLRIFNFDADDYYFSYKDRLENQDFLKDLVCQLDYYDSADRDLLLSIFRDNKCLYMWYWNNAPAMTNILIGSRRAAMTPTAVVRLNFLQDLLSLPISTFQKQKESSRELAKYCRAMIHPTLWGTPSKHGQNLFIFPFQNDFGERVSIRIASVGVLHKFFERCTQVINLIHTELSDHPKFNEFVETSTLTIRRYCLVSFGSYVKMITDGSFLYNWKRTAFFKTHHWSSQAYHYAGALALKLIPYYLCFFPQDENRYHYDLIADKIPVSHFSAKAWSDIFSMVKDLDWKRRQIIFSSNYLMNAFPRWNNQEKHLYEQEAFSQSTKNLAELYFWNQTFFLQSKVRWYDSFMNSITESVDKNTTFESITFHDPNHASKFAILGAVKGILSVSTREESMDILSRMGYSQEKYPELSMFLSPPRRVTKIDPTVSKFCPRSLQDGAPHTILVRMSHVPLFDVAAKLDEIYQFSVDRLDMHLYWRACYDLCHVASMFDFEYVYGEENLRKMLHDIPLNCLLIHMDRCVNQDELFSKYFQELYDSACLSLEKEPLFMMPFFCTQIFNSLTRCKSTAFTFYQQLLMLIIQRTLNRGEINVDFGRCFTDRLVIEKLFVRSTQTGLLLLFVMRHIVDNKLLKTLPQNARADLLLLLKSQAKNSNYHSSISHILEHFGEIAEVRPEGMAEFHQDNTKDDELDLDIGIMDVDLADLHKTAVSEDLIEYEFEESDEEEEEQFNDVQEASRENNEKQDDAESQRDEASGLEVAPSALPEEEQKVNSPAKDTSEENFTTSPVPSNVTEPVSSDEKKASKKKKSKKSKEKKSSKKKKSKKSKKRKRSAGTDSDEEAPKKKRKSE